VLGVALVVEFADELADGLKGAALPGIKQSLGLTYGQLGLLAALPLLVGGLLELPASGAFVSLTQSSLMDADPGRHSQLMAR
jgi:hypothetical protein